MTVYTPREDSFLLRDHIRQLDLDGKKVLDMGTGSGIIAIEAAKNGADVTAADINPEAINYADEQARKKGLEDSIEFVESDLFQDVNGKYDFILFNPPYLPEKEGVSGEKTWEGGETGVEITRQFIDSAQTHLSENGQLIVIMSSHARWQDLTDEYSLEVIGSEKLWFETLYLARSK